MSYRADVAKHRHVQQQQQPGQMGRENLLLCYVRSTPTASGCASLGHADCVGFLGQGAQNWLGNH